MTPLFEMDETFYVATKLCLKWNESILTLFESHPGLPLWRDLPGGKISKTDKNEDIFFTLRREIKEELGIDIVFDTSNTKLFSLEKKYERTTKGEIRPFIFLCYLYEIHDIPRFVLTENTSTQWITQDQIDTC